MTKKVTVSLLLAVGIATAAGLSIARPFAGSNGTVVVPEAFLRRWDPITVFFASSVGPKGGGPEDNPGRFVSVEPNHPGAFTWLDSTTLQFVPAEPWSALARIKVFVNGGPNKSLVTLMNPPVQTIPADRSDNVEPLDAITLTFAEPIPTESLAAMTRIELRPRPGLDASRARWLDKDDFKVKAMERRSTTDRATYVLQLAEPIREGVRATVHFKLSLDDQSESSVFDVSFSTLDAFQLLSFGCSNRNLPVTPEGSTYSVEQAIECPNRSGSVQLVFSSEPAAIDAVVANNLIRLTPAVENISVQRSGRTLTVSGRFEVETRYELSVHPTTLTDTKNRPLYMRGTSQMSFFFPRQAKYLTWQKPYGTVERYGPQTVPLSGRGFDRVDLRIHKVDALDRKWWPFPTSPVAVNESQRPPGPGEEPDARIPDTYEANASNIRERLRALGSPELSRIVDLPLERTGGAASFGLDLSSHLDQIAGRDMPGTYLVGVRSLDGSDARYWTRIQVTDLAVSVVEEPHAVRFFVTSLKSGRPVAGARVRVEGRKTSTWTTFFDARADAAGTAVWRPSGRVPNARLRRIVVELSDDRLVLDTNRPPERFEHQRWHSSGSGWLGWTVSTPTESRGDQPKELCHVFTERPVYRPDEKVHIKGYVRRRHEGALSYGNGTDLQLRVRGAGNLEFTWPIELTSAGSFYRAFAEANLPTGVYTAQLIDKRRQSLCQVNFSMEAYRIPKFEVRVFGDDTVALDGPFTVRTAATYYAGGPVAGRPVRWRVTQFPYDWSPSTKAEGFFYSTDSRFSRRGQFSSTPNLGRQDTTDETGASALELNPALESTARPRRYVVEATVTGADDQTVTATKQFKALPPFVLGLKVPRFLERAKKIRPSIIAVNPAGAMVPDQEVLVRLVHRTWHSHLQASDFSDGVAKYITDVVDTNVLERKVKTAATPVSLDLPLATGGVYVVEIESRDRLGRAQVVAVDLYAGGDEAVSWKKPEDKVFDVSTDKPRYVPGDRAKFLVKSPFLSGRVLVVVESPDKNSYEWVDVKGGVATYEHLVGKNEVPRLPVHFVLMRGRSGPPPARAIALDLTKPATMASTQWIQVDPVEHQLAVTVEHAPRAQPGDKVKMAITLRDRQGKPRSGEVTLWLVDQAVLALGKEQALDPLAAFITNTQSYVSVADTRNDVFGRLPYAENPGGDGAESDDEMSRSAAQGLLDKVSVRKRFESVPVFLPNVQVGASGKTTVDIQLPDNLTNFKIRVKAVSGSDRFGHAESTIAVRLPVLVQPSLPRFVRVGDTLVGGGIARVVEGSGGKGQAQVSVTSAAIDGGTTQRILLAKNRATRVDFGVRVGKLRFDNDPAKHPKLMMKLAVERTADKARDAFQVELPIREDRTLETRRVLKMLATGETLTLEGATEPARPGTARRTILVSDEPALVQMASSLDALVAYPHGNTEARISQARAFLATKRFRTLLHMSKDEKNTKRAIEDTLAWIGQVMDGSGLCAQWPGSRGYVWLTATALELMVEAKAGGFEIDAAAWQKAVATLERALRSDYSHFISGESWSERVASLRALAYAKRFNAAYAAELSNKAQYLDVEGMAGVAQAFVVAEAGNPGTLERLSDQMWDGVIVRLHQGKEIYGGLQSKHGARSSLILPSETRTLAEMVRALNMVNPAQVKLPLLVDALTTLGTGDGWGTTNANASALLALSERLEPGKNTTPRTIEIVSGKTKNRLQITSDSPVVFHSSDRIEPTTIRAQGSGPVIVRIETSYVPESAGSTVEKEARGFVVTRQSLQIVANTPPVKRSLDEAGQTLERKIGDVIEEHVQIVNPKDRNYVAVRVPLAAGMEPMNAKLATAPPEASPTGRDTTAPTYLAFMDDHVTYYFDSLKKGTYDFYFRTRAATEGTFTQPPAYAEMMYDATVTGRSPGAQVVVKRPTKE